MVSLDIYGCMNLDKVIDLFKPNNIKEEIKYDLDKLRSSPYYKLKMFIKYMDNYPNFMKSIYVSIEEGGGGDGTKLVDGAKYFYICNAYSQINSYDLDRFWGVELKYVYSKKFIKYLESCIKIFEKYEAYEKCLHIKNIIDFSQEMFGSPKKS